MGDMVPRARACFAGRTPGFHPWHQIGPEAKLGVKLLVSPLNQITNKPEDTEVLQRCLLGCKIPGRQSEEMRC